MKTFAIGDVHGMASKLEALLNRLPLDPARDRLIFLGDLIDRGTDSLHVVERVMALGAVMADRLVCLRGNHEDMVVKAAKSGSTFDLVNWLYNGGNRTLESYGASSPDELPASHLDFFRSLPCWWEDERHIYVHGDVDPDLWPAETPSQVLLWGRGMHGHALSGKIVICGHTPQAHGILRRDDLFCIDTGACYSYPGMGVLTAIDLATYETWQT